MTQYSQAYSLKNDLDFTRFALFSRKTSSSKISTNRSRKKKLQLTNSQSKSRKNWDFYKILINLHLELPHNLCIPVFSYALLNSIEIILLIYQSISFLLILGFGFSHSQLGDVQSAQKLFLKQHFIKQHFIKQHFIKLKQH